MIGVKMKRNTYDIFWLSKDMQNMGYIFEYCNKYCKDLYNINIDTEQFLTTFMKSNIRKEAETGHAGILSQAAIDTIQLFVEVDCNNNIEQFKRIKSTRYVENQLYWIGWMYAYLHYQSDMPCNKLVDILPINKMKEYYYLGHEMDVQTFYEKVAGILERKQAI